MFLVSSIYHVNRVCSQCLTLQHSNATAILAMKPRLSRNLVSWAPFTCIQALENTKLFYILKDSSLFVALKVPWQTRFHALRLIPRQCCYCKAKHYTHYRCVVLLKRNIGNLMKVQCFNTPYRSCRLGHPRKRKSVRIGSIFFQSRRPLQRHLEFIYRLVFI